MLSRVANQVYWLARYLERAEDSARMLNAYFHVVLDLPASVRLKWLDLIHITGNWTLFESRYKRLDERNVMNFLLADTRNPGSVVSAISMARENLRTTREIFPSEIWETLNGLFRYSLENASSAIARRNRYGFLREVIGECQLIYGVLSGSMSRDAVYRFLTLGFNIERIDMTTRILDVGVATINSQSDISDRMKDALWLSIVKAVNAEQMFRRRRLAVSAETAIEFMLHDEHFPRAISRCLEAIDTSFKSLPRNRGPRNALRKFYREVDAVQVDELFTSEITERLDWLQLELAVVHERIAKTWFRL